MDDILVVTDTFWHGNQLVVKGSTVRRGHPLVEGRERFFRPLVVDYDIEAKPEPKRPERLQRPERGKTSTGEPLGKPKE